MDNPDQSTITEIVYKAIINNHAVKVDQVDASMSLDDLKVDSLEKLSLAMDFEEQFSIDISDEDVEAFLTIGDIVTYLEQSVAEAANNAAQSTPPNQGEELQPEADAEL